MATKRRIWHMHCVFRMSGEQIDRELCLPAGTAHRVVMEWIRYKNGKE